MQNPQGISPMEMHRYDTHRNIPWNMPQYSPLKNSFDHRQCKQQRLFASQKKGVKVSDNYVTRRGFYLDYHTKVMSKVPSSAAYQEQLPWDGTHHFFDAQELQSVRKATKRTYLEQIENSAAKTPGVCKYEINRSIQTKEKKVEYGDRRWYLQDTEAVGGAVPGMGQYNPHDDVVHIRQRKDNHKTMKKRHEMLSKSEYIRSNKLPAAGTYTPVPLDTFDWLKGRKKAIKNGFGGDARFPYVRKDTKAIKEIRPAPCAYETRIQWKDKSVSPKKKEWIKMIWKGSPDKVYS